MPNYRGISNIADGIREGLITYQTISNLKQQKQQADQLMKLQMAEKGLIQQVDPLTGEQTLAKDPAFEEKQLQDQINKAALDGKVLERDGRGLIFKGYSPEYVNAQKEIYGAKNPFGLFSPGSKARDNEYAKDYVDYAAGGGAATIEKNLGLIGGAIGKLEEPGEISGGLLTKVPGGSSDAVQDVVNPDLAEVRDNIRTAVQTSLKQILGGQFTQREADNMFSRAYNPRLSDRANADRAREIMQELEGMKNAKEEAARYFEEKGTLQGFKPRSNKAPSGPQKIRVSNGKETLLIDASDLKDAEADGYREVK